MRFVTRATSSLDKQTHRAEQGLRAGLAVRALVSILVLGETVLAAPLPVAGPNGETVFTQKCMLCHGPGLRAPDLEQLRKLSAQHVYEVLKTGAMQVQAASLSDAEKHAVADWVGNPQKVTERGDLNPCKAKASSTPRGRNLDGVVARDHQHALSAVCGSRSLRHGYSFSRTQVGIRVSGDEHSRNTADGRRWAPVHR